MSDIDSMPIDGGTLRWRNVGGLSFDQVHAAWQSDPSFREFWIAGLNTVPFDAYCWECPPVTSSTVSRAFECVFVASPSLARMPSNKEAFAEHFRRDCDVAAFENLGGDALLVAPCPESAGTDFSHLASFTRTASPSLQQSLWAAVGDAVASHIGKRPLWLSTAGHGVAWLHVRLDSRPKYYRYAPYRDG